MVLKFIILGKKLTDFELLKLLKKYIFMEKKKEEKKEDKEEEEEENGNVCTRCFPILIFF